MRAHKAIGSLIKVLYNPPFTAFDNSASVTCYTFIELETMGQTLPALDGRFSLLCFYATLDITQHLLLYAHPRLYPGIIGSSLFN